VDSPTFGIPESGPRTAVRRPTDIDKKKLEDYEQPPLDDAIREELEAYVVRRRAELGD
jgi:trimethylamine---corrinoid protein Co-methyltransferase